MGANLSVSEGICAPSRFFACRHMCDKPLLYVLAACSVLAGMEGTEGSKKQKDIGPCLGGLH